MTPLLGRHPSLPGAGLDALLPKLPFPVETIVLHCNVLFTARSLLHGAQGLGAVYLISLIIAPSLVIADQYIFIDCYSGSSPLTLSWFLGSLVPSTVILYKNCLYLV